MSALYLISKGSTAKKENGRIVIEKDGHLMGRLPIRSIDSIVVGHLANISTPALFACMEAKIPVFFIDKNNKISGQLINEKISLEILKKQLKISESIPVSLELSKKIINEKIKNQYQLLKSYARTIKNIRLTKSLNALKAEYEKINNIKDKETLMGIEGICAKNYFLGFVSLLDNRIWHFQGRERPAKDPVNALLNFGYAFLEKEARVAIIGEGLNPRIGFLHSSNDRKDSLVFDLMELFRQPVIDRFVLNLLRLRTFKAQDFEKNENEECRLHDESRAVWYQKYENYMEKSYSEYEGKTSRELIQTRVREFCKYMMDISFK